MPYWANWSEQKGQEKPLGETKSPRQDIKNSNDAKGKDKKEEKTRSQRHGHPRHRMATCSGCTKPDKTEEEWPSLSETLSVTKSHRRPWRPRPGAGGKKNSATSDHILILQTTIKESRRKKPVYIFFYRCNQNQCLVRCNPVCHAQRRTKHPRMEHSKKNWTKTSRRKTIQNMEKQEQSPSKKAENREGSYQWYNMHY